MLSKRINVSHSLNFLLKVSLFSNLTYYLNKKGLPQITEYHILKNKRYILTNSTDPQIAANLWSLETGKIVKTWKNEKYENVKQFVNNHYDIGG